MFFSNKLKLLILPILANYFNNKNWYDRFYLGYSESISELNRNKQTKTLYRNYIDIRLANDIKMGMIHYKFP